MLKLYRGLSKYTGQILLLVLLLFGQSFTLLFLPNIMSVIVDRGVVGQDIPFILQSGFWMLLISIGGSLCAIGVGYFAAKASVGLCTDIRKKLFRHIGRFTLAEFDQVGTSSLVTRSTNDIMQFQNFTIMMFRVIVLAPIMCIGGIALSLQKNWRLALVLVFCMPIILLILFFILRRVLPVFRSMQAKLDKVNLVLRENITGVRVIRAFTAEEREEERFEEANEDMTAASIRSQTIVATLMPIMMLVMNLCTVIIVWFGGNQIAAGAMQVGDLMAFIQYMMLIMYALIMMSLILALMPRSAVCAARINEVMAIQPTIVNPENAQRPVSPSGVVEFRNVALRYGSAKEAAVKNISFTAQPGQTTALIGATGSGKSSVICMIPRLRDASEGEVLVDGVNVKNYELDALRARIGYVPQKAVLFSGTIHSNIAYGQPNLPFEKVKRAAEIAQADGFIMEKDKQYDDPVAQGGTNVSGGQRQRLTIARAFARDSSIFVFDDSFSALDFKTDAALRAAIKESTPNATVIIVAQRVNTILNADQILVLDKGGIVGRGTHAELLETCPVYAEIASTQLS